MKKAAIIINEQINNFNHSDYDLLIGVEKGAIFVYDLDTKIPKHYISDFDSVTEELKNKISSMENSTILDHETKRWADGEEAILFAIEKGYAGENIDIYVNTWGREDHFINMIMILRKYGSRMISNNSRFLILEPNKDYEINKDIYKFVSLAFFKQTKVKTEGLKWDIDRGYDVSTGTNCISNEIKGESFVIRVDQKVLLTQAND